MEQYDLVVIGSSWAGIYAAKTAVQLQARVALVTHSDRPYLADDTLLISSLQQLGQEYQRLQDDFWSPSQTSVPATFWTQASDWLEEVEQTAIEINSLASLAALGVDIIVGKGEFYRLPQLGLQVGKRNLRSRHFLLATGSNFLPDLGDATGDYLTLRDLKGQNLVNLPSEIIVVASDPIGLALAQSLARLGKKITLVVKHSRILPQEDSDISRLLHAQLEAEGIEIFTKAPINQIKVIAGQKWLQAGDRALSAPEIILADYYQPNIQDLNLAGVEVKYNQQRIYVNRKLQTTNPRIYACGDLIGGYHLPSIARYEVNLILKNTLFLPWYKTNYQTIPWAILTQPNLARVGLNQWQAQQQNITDVYIIKESFSELMPAQITNQITGICKLLVNRQGRIIGCSIFGDRAAELIVIPALMMQQKIKLDANPMRGLTTTSLPVIAPSLAEILVAAQQSFYQQKLQDNPQLIKRLRTWLALMNPK